MGCQMIGPAPVHDHAPAGGRQLLIRIKDNGTIHHAHVECGPTVQSAWHCRLATAAGKTVHVRCVYNATDSVWDVLAVNQEA